MSRNHNHKIIPSLMIFTGMIFVSMHLFCIDDPVESITGPSDPVPDPDPIGWSCIIPAGTEPDSSGKIGCEEDFLALASTPLNSSIPGAISVKTVIDDWDNDKIQLYFRTVKI